MAEYPEARFIASASNASQFLADDGCEVAFAGRSNAGKSSAINALVHRRNFARTSKTPGRTQLVNFFHLADEQRLIDLPGYGFAKVGRDVQRHWQRLMTDYFERRASLTGVFLMVDSRRGLKEFDVQMLEWTVGMGLDVHVLLTKADKLKRRQATDTLRSVKKELDGQATVQLFSALKKTGVPEARLRLNEMLSGENPAAAEAESA